MVTHPDRRGGLSFLSWPSAGFAQVILGVSVVQAGVWADRVAFQGAGITDLKEELLVAAIVSLAISLGPLLSFGRLLWRARFDGLRDYGRLGTDYTRLFHARWIERQEREGLLGTADIQSLADLASAYDVVRQMRVLPFTLRSAVVVVLAVVIPTVPVVLMKVPFFELLGRLSKVALGGLSP
jgi:hypothetical protein